MPVQQTRQPSPARPGASRSLSKFFGRRELDAEGRARNKELSNNILAFGMILFLLFLVPVIGLGAVQAGKAAWKPNEDVHALNVNVFENHHNNQLQRGQLFLAGAFKCGDDESCSKSRFRVTVPEGSKIASLRLGPDDLRPEKTEADDSKKVDVYWADVPKEKRITKYLSMTFTCESSKTVKVWVDLKTPIGTSTAEAEARCP